MIGFLKLLLFSDEVISEDGVDGDDDEGVEDEVISCCSRTFFAYLIASRYLFNLIQHLK